MERGIARLVQIASESGPITVLAVGNMAIVGVDNINFSSDAQGPYMDVRIRSFLVGSPEAGHVAADDQSDPESPQSEVRLPINNDGLGNPHSMG